MHPKVQSRVATISWMYVAPVVRRDCIRLNVCRFDEPMIPKAVRSSHVHLGQRNDYIARSWALLLLEFARKL